MGRVRADDRRRRLPRPDRRGADLAASCPQGGSLSGAARDGDAALAARVAAGDRRAFGELVSRHQGAVRSFLARLAGDAALADDLAQETFLRAHARIATFGGAGSLKSWLCAIAYREFLMALRKDRAARRTLDRLSSEDAPETHETAPDAALDLDRALGALKAEERAAVLLCYAAGMSHAEAALAMGAPLGTVKSWVNRGRDKLRERLAGHAPV